MNVVGTVRMLLAGWEHKREITDKEHKEHYTALIEEIDRLRSVIKNVQEAVKPL